MKITVKEYCIRCGICSDLYPELFKFNMDEDRIDAATDEVPAALEEKAKAAAGDCAIAAIFLR
jgi:ferredoxin